ncbi:MAG: glycosyltransferase family 4 protein [Candidatus Nealsonbacteria bacterium]
MKIILATSIFPPDIGGPAQYVKNLERRLKERGIETEVISYNNLKKYPQPLRFFLYSLNLFKRAQNIDIIYVFNLISCGLPAYCISRFFKKKFAIRIGGDFLWERKIELNNTEQSLKEYYQHPKNLKEKFFIFLIKNILKGADIVIFSSNFQREIYLKHFQILKEKTVVVSNPFPEIETPTSKSENTYQFLYAGRLLKLKNLDKLIEVFNKVVEKTSKPLILKIIGDGPEKKNLEKKISDLGLNEKIVIEKSIPYSELLKEIVKSYVCILPSFTDISPNFILECIKLKKPVLLTKETEYYQEFKNSLIFLDPKDEKDIEEKITYLLDDINYQNYSVKIQNIPTTYSWNDIVEKHILLFQKIQ